MKAKSISIAAITSFAILFLFASPSIMVSAYSAPSAVVNCFNVNVCGYVQNYGASSVTAFNGTKAFKTITVGSGPVGQEAYDFVHGNVVTPDSGSNAITVINAVTQKTKTIFSGTFSEPAGALYDPDSNTIYIANFGSSSVSFVNATSLKVSSKTVTVGTNPEFFGFNPVNHEVYVSDVSSASVTVFNSMTNKVKTTISVGSDPRGIAFDPANNNTYVANEGSSTVSVINLKNHVSKTLSGFDVPWGVNYGNGIIYVVNVGNGVITEISSTNHMKSVTGQNEVPTMGAYDPKNGYEYVTLEANNEVEIIFGTHLLSKTIPVGSEPQGIITTAFLP
jgi:YVTN family beta-propeller protein